ncbi:MAG: signal recognition particle receptor subunit alpha, partial [Pseudothermotoga sp.]
MFENLQEKLSKIFKSLTGQGRLTERNINDAVRQVKLSLLEADVNFRVVKEFIDSVKEKALGEEVLKSFTPDQQFIKIVRDELINIMGKSSVSLNLKHHPSVLMLVGLQGSGKTTTAAKLANHLRKSGRNVLLVAADTYRPAAIDQLEKLGKSIQINVFVGDRKNPINIVKEALEFAKNSQYNVVVLDTAGRLHIDEEMMNELEQIKHLSGPDEILMVVDAMVGQDAVNSATEFDR